MILLPWCNERRKNKRRKEQKNKKKKNLIPFHVFSIAKIPSSSSSISQELSPCFLLFLSFSFLHRLNRLNRLNRRLPLPPSESNQMMLGFLPLFSDPTLRLPTKFLKLKLALRVFTKKNKPEIPKEGENFFFSSFSFLFFFSFFFFFFLLFSLPHWPTTLFSPLAVERQLEERV